MKIKNLDLNTLGKQLKKSQQNLDEVRTKLLLNNARNPDNVIVIEKDNTITQLNGIINSIKTEIDFRTSKPVRCALPKKQQRVLGLIEKI